MTSPTISSLNATATQPVKHLDLTSPDTDLNLKHLADYLISLPADYKGFEMAEYVVPADFDIHNGDLDDVDWEPIQNYALNNGGVAECGSVACAVGHGPASHMFMKPDEISYDGRPNWQAYTRRVFNLNSYDSAFYWMFGAVWADYDNTPHGAARRIRYFLKNGDAPAAFKANIYGDLTPFMELYANA